MEQGRDSERDDLDWVCVCSGGTVVKYQVTLPPVNLWNYTKIDYWRIEMTDKKTEALKLALEALRDYRRSDDDRVSVAMGILQEALAEQPAQQQEPVAHQYQDREGVWRDFMNEKHYKDTVADGTWPIRSLCVCALQPASKPWVGLTDEEFQMIYDIGRTPAGMMELVEAKLKEKNT